MSQHISTSHPNTDSPDHSDTDPPESPTNSLTSTGDESGYIKPLPWGFGYGFFFEDDGSKRPFFQADTLNELKRTVKNAGWQAQFAH